ncbi:MULTISPECIES: hypothetical protein, partial [unclassified Bradyrhizobium]|uniref:hypothetical protein n=1 Tax=unclassified Bradyrhizobium TaxID=2631580 RepID=UPI001FFB9D9D
RREKKAEGRVEAVSLLAGLFGVELTFASLFSCLDTSFAIAARLCSNSVDPRGKFRPACAYLTADVGSRWSTYPD